MGPMGTFGILTAATVASVALAWPVNRDQCKGGMPIRGGNGVPGSRSVLFELCLGNSINKDNSKDGKK